MNNNKKLEGLRLLAEAKTYNQVISIAKNYNLDISVIKEFMPQNIADKINVITEYCGINDTEQALQILKLHADIANKPMTKEQALAELLELDDQVAEDIISSIDEFRAVQHSIFDETFYSSTDYQINQNFVGDEPLVKDEDADEDVLETKILC